MKNKEQLAEQYAEEQNSAYTNDYNGFINGWDSAVEKIKEYLFNTAESQDNITEEYLKQTIKFLNDL